MCTREYVRKESLGVLRGPPPPVDSMVAHLRTGKLVVAPPPNHKPQANKTIQKDSSQVKWMSMKAAASESNLQL